MREGSCINNKEIKVRDETSGKKNLSFKEFKETKEKQRATFSSPIYTAENIGTARIKVVRVPPKNSTD